MAVALVDSNVLIAARLARDQNHEGGTAIVNGIDTGRLPSVRIPDDALSEVLNYIHTRADHDAAVETLDAVLSAEHFELDRTIDADFDTERTLFRRYDGLSFTDSVLCAYARRTGLDYVYSFDNDFDAVDGLTRLGTAENPFSG